MKNNFKKRLKVLADNRKTLLLAEVAAWLHDMGKCSDEMIEKQARKETNDCSKGLAFPKGKGHKTYFSDYLPDIDISLSVEKTVEKISIKDLTGERNDLVEKRKISTGNKEELEKELEGLTRKERGRKKWKQEEDLLPWLFRVLSRCHNAAHVEKEEFKIKGDAPEEHKEEYKTIVEKAKQTIKDTRLSTPFGYEGEPLGGLTDRLKSLPFDSLKAIAQNHANYIQFRGVVEKTFKVAFADTRRPINEVTLWDWSNMVAALYKAALARALLLQEKPEPKDLRWRLLSIRFDEAQFNEQVANLPALLARRQWLQDGLDNVRKLLEFDYPLGSEVYRDENGSIFAIPDIADILSCQDDSGKELITLIEEKLNFSGELKPDIDIDDKSWWAQRPNRRDSSQEDEVPPIAKHLGKIPLATADPVKVSKWWEGQNNREICLVSGVRPQGPSGTGRARKISDYWLERIRGRAESWLKNLETTIWIDEVADLNGRVCLLVGQLGLADWLEQDDGYSYAETILFHDPCDPAAVSGSSASLVKNASFSYLYRIWRTTKQFWKEVSSEIAGDGKGGEVASRLKIKGIFSGKEEIKSSQAYELNIGDAVSLSVVSSATGDYFLTIENLGRIARLLGSPEDVGQNYARVANYVREKLFARKSFPLEEPSGYGATKKLLGSLNIQTVEETMSYSPVIPISTETSTFSILLPADKAFKIALKIKDKYEREMNKVRNRLPLTLGLVFAGHRTPLPAIIDAGRRMLRQPTLMEQWQVDDIVSLPDDDFNNLPAKELKLIKNGQELQIRVNTKMGDEETQDCWYPYWKVKEDKNGLEVSSRKRQFKLKDKNKNENIWVHIDGLQKGDVVCLTPSRFDFEFLDTAARRFEISYAEGRRCGNIKSARPYYLEELDDFEFFWHLLACGLSRSQIKHLVELVERKRSEWSGEKEQEVLEQFVKDMLNNVYWRERKYPEETEFSRLCKMAASGKLVDILELFMAILKRK